MPRSVLRPPAVRVVASRAMDALCRLLEGGSAALKALSIGGGLAKLGFRL